MREYRRVVKDWLRAVDREELNAVLKSAIFTPDELEYIKMRILKVRALSS